MQSNTRCRAALDQRHAQQKDCRKEHCRQKKNNGREANAEHGSGKRIKELTQPLKNMEVNPETDNDKIMKYSRVPLLA